MQPDKLKCFMVRTCHQGDNNFVAPVEIEANSHQEAADIRLNQLPKDTQERVKAILVRESRVWGSGEPQLFYVSTRPTAVPA